MQVQLEVPEEVARQFADEPGGVVRATLEALAGEGVRSGKLTVHQAARMPGISSRHEMDGFLKAHGVLLSASIDDIRRDAETAIRFAR